MQSGPTEKIKLSKQMDWRAALLATTIHDVALVHWRWQLTLEVPIGSWGWQMIEPRINQHKRIEHREPVLPQESFSI